MCVTKVHPYGQHRCSAPIVPPETLKVKKSTKARISEAMLSLGTSTRHDGTPA